MGQSGEATVGETEEELLKKRNTGAEMAYRRLLDVLGQNPLPGEEEDEALETLRRGIEELGPEEQGEREQLQDVRDGDEFEEDRAALSRHYTNLLKFLKHPQEEFEVGHKLRPQPPRGREVGSLSELGVNSDEFVRFQADSPSFHTIMKKREERRLSNLFVEEQAYEVDFVPVRGAARQRYLFTLIDLIKEVLEEIFAYMVKARGSTQNSTEVQMSIGSKKLKPHLGSGIYPLTMDNCDAIVNELLWQLLQYSQSDTRSITVSDLYIKVTLGDVRLGGDGYYLPLRRYYNEKRYCALKDVGSILFVESQELCFFVAIFLSRTYAALTDRIKSSANRSEKKRLRRRLNQILTADNVVERTINFFKKLRIDISNLPAGEISTMMLISAALDCTISILDEGASYKTVLRTPEKLDPLRPHVVLLRVGLLEAKKPTPTGIKKASNVHHYHAARTAQSVLVSQVMYWCSNCGQAMPNNSRSLHLRECLGPLKHCESCRRPVLNSELYAYVKAHQRPEYCTKMPNDEKASSRFGCKVVSQGLQCHSIHESQCHNHICPLCQQIVHIKGKYIKKLKELKKNARNADDDDDRVLISHDDCLEIYCNICQEHYTLEGLDIKRDESHCCFLSSLKKANTWGPICSLDMETCQDPETGKLRVNTICLISPVKEVKDQFFRFECRVFSDVCPELPYRGVALGEPIPVNIEGQDTYLNEDLCQFDGKKRRRSGGGGDESDSELLRLNEDLLRTIHSQAGEARSSEVDSQSSDSLDAGGEGGTRTVPPNSARLELDGIISRYQRRNNISAAKEQDFNINAQRARPSESPSTSSEEEDNRMDRRVRQKKKRKRSMFIDDMAQVSDSSEDSSSEDSLSIPSTPPVVVSKKRCRDEMQVSPSIPTLVRPKAKAKQMIPCQSSSESETSSQPAASGKQTFGSPNLAQSGSLGVILGPPASVTLDQNLSVSEPEPIQDDNDEHLLLDGDLKTIDEATPFCAHESRAQAQDRIRRAFLETRRYQAQSQEPGYPVLDRLFEFLFASPHLSGSVILCHFGRRFDAILIQEFLTEAGFPFKVIEVANSVIGMTILKMNLIVLDFFSYFNCALSKLPKNLGLSSSCKKGYFPHFLNQIENYLLKIPHCPPREYYQEWKMNDERRSEFHTWFKSIKNQPFDFRSQLLDYCVVDTEVLHAAILKFLKTCLQQEKEMARAYDPKLLQDFSGGDREVILSTGRSGYPKAIFPFSKQSWTLSGYASLLMAKYAVRQFPKMPILKHEDEEIGMQRSSQEEMIFLLYMKMKEYPNLECGLTNTAQRSFVCVDHDQTPPKSHTFYVDGFCPDTKVVVEYLGCMWHQHPRKECYSPSTKSHGGFYLGDARARTEKRIKLLKNHRDISDVRTWYSCQWQRFMSQHPDLRNSLKAACGRMHPLNLRSVFRGGVVSCFCAHFDSRKINKFVIQVFGRPPPDEGRGLFLDFASYYPALLSSISTGFFERQEDRVKLPYGPPTCIRTHDLCMAACPPSQWKDLVGAASVRILPPTRERFPILRLDIKRNDRITQVAALCRSCAESASFLDGADCQHEDEERALTGSFTFLRLIYAIEEQHYQLEEVYEVHFYKDFCTEYLEKFLETCAHLKVVSEGFPQDITTEEQKEAYVRELSRETGLSIDVGDICESPAQRSNGKMLMNAQVGKTGQQIIRDSKFYVTNYEELAKIRADQTVKIKSYTVVSDTTVRVTTKTEKAVAQPFKRGNLMIAAMCTSAARLHLIKHLTLLEAEGYCAAYSDTDSFLVVPLHPDCRPIHELVRVGSRLGSLKVEHSGVEAFTGLLKKAYVFSKRLSPQKTSEESAQEESQASESNCDADSSCHILEAADQPLYPPAQVADPTECVTVKFKGISNASAILKANEACGLIKQELFDVLAQNPRPLILIQQERLKLNQKGKIGIWASDASKSFKRLAMSNSARYFDLRSCVSITEVEDPSAEEDEDGEMQHEIRLGLKGAERKGEKPKKKRNI